MYQVLVEQQAPSVDKNSGICQGANPHQNTMLGHGWIFNQA